MRSECCHFCKARKRSFVRQENDWQLDFDHSNIRPRQRRRPNLENILGRLSDPLTQSAAQVLLHKALFVHENTPFLIMTNRRASHNLFSPPFLLRDDEHPKTLPAERLDRLGGAIQSTLKLLQSSTVLIFNTAPYSIQSRLSFTIKSRSLPVPPIPRPIFTLVLLSNESHEIARMSKYSLYLAGHFLVTLLPFVTRVSLQNLHS